MVCVCVSPSAQLLRMYAQLKTLESRNNHVVFHCQLSDIPYQES